MGLLEVENLTYFYPEKNEPSLEKVSLDVPEGEFLFLAGPSGCGKSTLLKAMAGLLPDYYGGRISGSVCFEGRPLAKWDSRRLAREIGMIFQDPEQQTVMTTVEHELAFGLENLGLTRSEMKRRVAEVIALFDLGKYRNEQTASLPGGLKQKVVLAAVLAMQPRVLLLDEPTSQLDPVAAQDFLNYVHRLNLEWGLTVIMVEQRIDRCFHLADRVVFMDKGRDAARGTPGEVMRNANGFTSFFPPVSRVFALSGMDEIPVTIKEGRSKLARITENMVSKTGSPGEDTVISGEKPREQPLLEARNIHYAYPGRDFCLNDIDISLYPGEVTAVLGENGAGKSTLLKNLCGLLKPRRGKLIFRGRNITAEPVEKTAMHIGLLTQDPNDYLLSDTVTEELEFGLKTRGIKDMTPAGAILKKLRIEKYAMTHPRDLSGGEKQRVALGTVLVTGPSVLLLDEPTRGMDPGLKNGLAELIRELAGDGMSIMLVTHDVEFAALAADRVILLSDGRIAASGGKSNVLSDSLYYAPQVNRLFRGISGDVMTVEDGVKTLRILLSQKGGTA